MRIGTERKKYLADALAKVGEYTFAVAILGTIASGELQLSYLAGLFYVVVVSAGILLTPEE